MYCHCAHTNIISCNSCCRCDQHILFIFFQCLNRLLNYCCLSGSSCATEQICMSDTVCVDLIGKRGHNVILPFADDFPKDTELYKLLTTKPSEVEHAAETEA